MPAQLEITCRVQYLRDGEWVTIGENLEGAIESGLLDVLAKWVRWFETSPVIRELNDEFCAFCLVRLNEDGHSESCIYAKTKRLLQNPQHCGKEE